MNAPSPDQPLPIPPESGAAREAAAPARFDCGEDVPSPSTPGPRERLRERGVAALSDAELLALIVGSGVAGRGVMRIGRALARRRPADLARWSPVRWLQVSGIGPARAAALTAAFELGRRAVERAPDQAPIRGPEDVLGYVRDLVRERREHFVVLLLNARHEMQARETISIGSLNASIVHPREVFLPAIQQSAASVVLVHNHPSGDPEPSEEDLTITRRLVQVGDLVGIGVLDHVIVASRGHLSFRSRGLL